MLFGSKPHIELAHSYWEKLLHKGDLTIDATCGNGHDTCKLAEILQSKGGGQVIGIDIQQEALERTKGLLISKNLTGVDLFCQSHANFPAVSSPVRLIVYNLGYLPRGDKQLTTLTESTLESVHNAIKLIMTGGALSITCYPGHPEGAKEEKALIKEISHLPSETFSICYHTFPNRLAAPNFLWIQKKNAININN
jgi:hypothetical protein